MLNNSQNISSRIQEVKNNKLKKLDLSNEHTTPFNEKLTEIPLEVFNLEWLEILNLSYNQITTIPTEISRLKYLTELNLSDNQITNLPEEITYLRKLTSLDLSSNNITNFPKVITRLYNLRILVLNYNQITTLPEDIVLLENLEEFYLKNNKLKIFPEVITRVEKLSLLHLSSNEITTLPETITRLKNLEHLYLRYNKLREIPDYIGNLQNLNILALSSNQITNIPLSISHLQNLTYLDLNDNKVTMLPELITHLNKLNRLDLSDNPIKKPPPEVVERGFEGIKDYFRQLEAEGIDYIYEAKLLIIGEAGAGKTTLAKKIEDPNYQLREENSTKGIEVILWKFLMHNERTFRVNIWDFGGQEIYHATHQFFLTKRSLYALVADTRKEDTDFYYWLKVVELLSNNSPLLIVKNEKQNRHREINHTYLRGEFSNLKETLATNLATNRGLLEILHQIKHYITSLPHIGNPLPKTWVRVREALESDSRDYISLDEYLNICQQNGFTQHKDKLQLSSYLHDLGVCLHFQDDPLLKRIVILKPKWGTDAVYKVLDNEKVICNQGKFTHYDLQIIWCEKKYETMRDELLRLMINFKLCYEIPRSETKSYIAPQLLSPNQPEFDSERKWDKRNNLILRYTYEFMPKGIITQFIVVMHEYIYSHFVWKSGVFLNKDHTMAEVIENYTKREIKIRVSGRHKRDLMTIVTHELDKIHSSYKRLKYKKLIPCNCNNCRDSQDPHSYPLEVLRKFVEDKQNDIQCQKSYEMVNVLGLIDDIMERSNFLKTTNHKSNDLLANASVTIEGNIGVFNIIHSLNKKNKIMSKPPKSSGESDQEVQVILPFAFRNGMFYLFIFVVVFCLIAFFGSVLPFHYLVLAIIGTAIFIILIGVLQLRQDDRLKEKNFIELIKLVIEQLPLFGNLIKQFQGKQ
ncbi:leucine-rich repeat domain-containing protein [Nostoc spongiaeforme FACHB-130]|uniref:Leucine-rich repeat domain-containing protein n=1 Tax=Nostoc spongiaeforme FACHB-130 TaxID=1357510 RepID=A0ABR8G617_9NOSO|nr:COR domain-containing protein [Nostoc spongiaeforme]MBD2598610.1 leucine-rich repeat domain-containing protein [Nostoc spongiaeforme FACHB-130]